MNTPKKQLIIINQEQFGYHIDTYYYCKYLRKKFDITYLGYESDKPRIHMDGITIVYVPRKGPRLIREARFFRSVQTLLRSQGGMVFIKYFKGCALFPLIFSKKRCLLDIRTGATFKNGIKRKLYDLLLKIEIRGFAHISVISKNLASRLKLSTDCKIIPLGADTISKEKKSFDTFHLLYVGTLYNRRIEDTIKGFSKFYQAYKDRIDTCYTIIGSGLGNEVEALKALAAAEGVGEAVHILGQIPHTDLEPFFDTHNIGVCYVPITVYFDVQPPTKNYEYLLSGMPVIATQTLENKAVISNTNGILIQDTAGDFYRGLVDLYQARRTYDSDQIRAGQQDHTWERIVLGFKQWLESVTDERPRKDI